ncbi:IclR family transcriptional regulator [Actinophytocola oryzae]|uniref:IclR family transcriptional regulator n=1 Tax=Actinophytocola oryzae TaxID=502181 RepID=A0A4R7VH98_9PSEU|nr:IclR family transcriptional regulator [Actinophytocola oryzae]TDV48714.1 IclR family transcriptional regulator [Actinophytocola oryzae]
MAEADLKTPPMYVVGSVDHALRAAVMLQLEGGLTVSQVADRLGVARSTAHRLLQTLVYRDFAVQDDQRVYHPGPVLELATYSQSFVSRLRGRALPHLQRLVDVVGESANLTIRTGDRTRFIASVECGQALRVGSREGMVFPAHRTTAGLVLLAELPPSEVDELYAEEHYAERLEERPDMAKLRTQLARVRRAGFAVNDGLSERGVVAIGVPVRDEDGTAVAGLSISMPSVRYDRDMLPSLVTTLHRAVGAIEAGGLAATGTSSS